MVRVAVIGGGAIGSSVAMFVRRALPKSSVTVIERDSCYTKASSALSASSIRQQFSAPINIQLSLFGLEYLRQPKVTSAVQFREGGYLLLAPNDEGVEILRKNQQLQESLGANIKFIDSPADLKARFPWINVDDLKAGCTGVTGEGWFDGFSLLQLLRQEAIQAGATYLRANATDIQVEGNRVTSVGYTPNDTSLEPARLECDYVVNAGGPWARSVAAMVSLDCPVAARRRVVYVVRTPSPIDGCPLVADPSGIWFRGDAPSQFLVGVHPPGADPDDQPLEIGEADKTLFDEHVWPALAHRVPAFECLTVKSSWAGYYEVHPMDHNAIVGPHPTRLPNFLFANGFSGHGMQHSVGVGRAIAEWIEHGQFKSLDLTPLHYDRVLTQSPFHENNVI